MTKCIAYRDDDHRSLTSGIGKQRWATDARYVDQGRNSCVHMTSRLHLQHLPKPAVYNIVQEGRPNKNRRVWAIIRSTARKKANRLRQASTAAGLLLDVPVLCTHHTYALQGPVLSFIQPLLAPFPICCRQPFCKFDCLFLNVARECVAIVNLDSSVYCFAIFLGNFIQLPRLLPCHSITGPIFPCNDLHPVLQYTLRP